MFRQGHADSVPARHRTCTGPVELLARHRRILRANRVGSTATYDMIVAYPSAEQRLGRIATRAQPEAVATALVGGCFQIAFLETHWAQKNDASGGVAQRRGRRASDRRRPVARALTSVDDANSRTCAAAVISTRADGEGARFRVLARHF
ncbi:MAG TPA: hypothetical protein VIA18_26415 [Polyangia bacterium]|nr:hypothetical protein [Polyangia bacterium]